MKINGATIQDYIRWAQDAQLNRQTAAIAALQLQPVERNAPIPALDDPSLAAATLELEYAHRRRGPAGKFKAPSQPSTAAKRVVAKAISRDLHGADAVAAEVDRRYAAHLLRMARQRVIDAARQCAVGAELASTCVEAASRFYDEEGAALAPTLASTTLRAPIGEQVPPAAFAVAAMVAGLEPLLQQRPSRKTRRGSRGGRR